MNSRVVGINFYIINSPSVQTRDWECWLVQYFPTYLAIWQIKYWAWSSWDTTFRYRVIVLYLWMLDWTVWRTENESVHLFAVVRMKVAGCCRHWCKTTAFSCPQKLEWSLCEWQKNHFWPTLHITENRNCTRGEFNLCFLEMPVVACYKINLIIGWYNLQGMKMLRNVVTHRIID